MTYREALAAFKADVLPRVSSDRPARSEAWCVFIDGLVRANRAEERHVTRWDNPWGHLGKNPGPRFRQ